METETVATSVAKLKEEAKRIAYLMADETLKQEFGADYGSIDPTELYERLEALAEEYESLILAKKIERLPFIKKGRGRPSKVEKKVKEFFKNYEKALEGTNKPKEPKYVVYGWIEVKQPSMREKALIPTYIGSFDDYQTAKYEAEANGGFILETKTVNPYISFIKTVKGTYTKSLNAQQKATLNKLKQLGQKYGVIRMTWTLMKHIDEQWVIYVPSMPIVFTPEFAKKTYRALFREYGNRKALFTQTTTMVTVIKIRRAVVPIYAEKVRKAELSALKTTIGKPLSLNAIRRNAF